jgi:catechol 2,3-dioxygenase-like lactoylglutathione lyase family enzyme
MTDRINEAFAQGIFAITLISHDLEKSRDFYGNKLSLKEVYRDENSSVYKAGTTMINCLASSQTEELIAPATLASIQSGTDVVYTLKCQDIDETVKELIARGVEILNGPIDRPWGIRTASFQDPSGHTWELANH